MIRCVGGDCVVVAFFQFTYQNFLDVRCNHIRDDGLALFLWTSEFVHVKELFEHARCTVRRLETLVGTYHMCLEQQINNIVVSNVPRATVTRTAQSKRLSSMPTARCWTYGELSREMSEELSGQRHAIQLFISPPEYWLNIVISTSFIE